MTRDFRVLPGFYQALFLYLERLLTLYPALVCFFSGAKWFHAQFVPGGAPSGALDARTTVAIWQLVNCYGLVALISSLVFRAIRDALPDNLEAQGRILGANMIALAFGDITHTIISWAGLPEESRYSFGSWNAMIQGNIMFPIFLFSVRMAWFAGIGRQLLIRKGDPKEPKVGLRVGSLP